MLSAKGQAFRLHDSGTPVDIPPSAWVGERSESRVGNAALLKKGWNSHPPSLETENIKRMKNYTCEHEVSSMFPVKQGDNQQTVYCLCFVCCLVVSDFFFGLVNLSHWDKFLLS